MIDHNLHNWQSIDWQTELDAYLNELAKATATPKQCMIFRRLAGRCILLMQEYLDQQDYEYVLQACQFGPDMACTYREIYLWSVEDHLDAPQPPHHYNCRCDLPYDEESES